jgi:hypothetical protein
MRGLDSAIVKPKAAARPASVRGLSVGLLVAACSGCFGPRAWLVERNSYGGVIGYREGSLGNEEEQQRMLQEAISEQAKKVCGFSRFRIVRELRREREFTYYTQQAVTTTTQSNVRLNSETRSSRSRATFDTETEGTVESTSTTYVPVQQTGIDSWWEATITCSFFSEPSSTSIGPETETVMPLRRIPTGTVTPVVRPQTTTASPQEPSAPPVSRCSAKDLEEMRKAGLSNSAISSACSP